MLDRIGRIVTDPRNRKAVYAVAAMVVIAAAVYVISPALSDDDKDVNQVPLSTAIRMAKEGEVREIIVDGNNLTIVPMRVNESGENLTTWYDGEEDIINVLLQSGVDIGAASGMEIKYEEPSEVVARLAVLFQIAFSLAMAIIILFYLNYMRGIMRFGLSTAKIMTKKPDTTFDHVAGADEAKAELHEVVEFLKSPEDFTSVGARIPKGILLIGPPGTGKTLIARAVAGEAGVTFFHLAGSEFVEMVVGVGASRARDLFKKAKKHSPSIVFIDEIDAVGRHRGGGSSGGHDERDQTLNQILVEMDGFETNSSVIVIAATNRQDVLDTALLRPGRFDRRIHIDLPDIQGRMAILNVHSAGKPLSDDVDMERIAKETPGFSGADLANVVNEAAILAGRVKSDVVRMCDFNEAVDRVIAGPERRSRAISSREKEITAYHEAGHALVAYMLPDADRVNKITIVSRGNSGGHTSLVQDEDRYLRTRSQFCDMMAVMMGGRAAEQVIFDEVTTGASNDIEQATKMASNMVKTFGMSESFGPRTFGNVNGHMPFGEERSYGEHFAAKIDDEIDAMVTMAHKRATDVVVSNRDKLVRLAEYLIEHETISGDDIACLFDGKQVIALPASSNAPRALATSPVFQDVTPDTGADSD